MSPPSRTLRVETAVALAALVAWSFAQRWAVLAESPFPLGVDGYFYPIQVRSVLEHGWLHQQYQASPMTIWWMVPFAWLTDPIIGAKLGAALGGALIALPAYGVGARLGASRGAGLIAAAVATASAGSAYLSIEFVKQGIGLTVALAAVWLALRAFDAATPGRVAAAAAGVIAALLTHKMAGAIIAIALPAAIERARMKGQLRGRRLIYVCSGLALLALVVIGLGVAAPRLFASGNEVALAMHLFEARAHWLAPGLDTGHVTLAFDHEALLGGAVAVLAAAALVAKRPTGAVRVIAWTSVALGVVIAVPWLAVSDPQGLAFRLRVAAFVPLALNAAVVAGWLGPNRKDDIVCAVFAIVVVVFASTRDRKEGEVLAHPALVAGAIASAHYIPDHATAIVPERHIAFMIAWYARANVALRPDNVPYAERVRVMPLALIREGSALDAALDAARADPTVIAPVGVHPRHRNGLVIVAEPTWDWLLARLPPRDRRHFTAWPTI